MPPIPEATLPEQGRSGHLLRVLGVGFGIAVTIGNTIGAGILRTPGEVATHLPQPWLFVGVWIAGGLYVLLGAISVAELGTMIPRAGGQYVYARRALGQYAGFIVGWSDWVSTCGTTAAVSIVIGEYTSALFPPLARQTVPIALATTLLFALLQWRGIRWGSQTQNLTGLLKAVAFLTLVGACFIFGGKTAIAPLPSPSTPTGLSLLVALILALQSVIYTYDGWAGVIYFSEEVRHPERNLPRALFGGVISIIGIYLLVNLALLYVLPIAQIAGQELAVGAAAQVIFGPYGDTIIRSLMILSMLSGVNAYHLMATRVLFAMSRDELFSRRAVEVNRGGTPTVALWISTMVAVLFILSGTFEQVIAVLAFFFITNNVMSFLSVFVLRHSEPHTPRPYRAWGYPWTTGLALAGAAVFLAGAVAGDTRNSLYALLLLGASYPAFLLIKRLQRAR